MQKINMKNYKSLAVAEALLGDVLYIGRNHPKIGYGSPLANPFAIGIYGDRQEVIEKYKKWLWGKIQDGDKAVLDELAKINEKTVFACWCAPLPCHADVLMSYYEWKERELCKT